MNAVGIDVSKGKSMIAVLRPLGEVVTKPYEVSHTAGELERLALSLKALTGETRVVLEYTGRYYEPVAQVLLKAGLFVCALNPILISQFGNNSVRRVKTDKKDALKIAKFALDNWTKLRQYTAMDENRQKMKILNRQYNLYMKTKSALKNNLIALLDQTFPGVNTLFDSPARDDGHQKWIDFADAFWHCDCAAGLSEKAFVDRYQKWCKRHKYYFSEDKAADIYRKSLGHITTLPKNDDTKLLITQAIAQLNAVSQTVEVFRAELLRLAQALPEYTVVMAMYGVGDTLGPQLMAEIGDVNRFKNRGAIVGFAGVDPDVSASGKYKASSMPVSKRGSPYLRKALFQIMQCLIQKSPPDDPVYAFMDKKRAEGKPYYVYMTAGANKFLRIYYARVKEFLGSADTTPSVQKT